MDINLRISTTINLMTAQETRLSVQNLYIGTARETLRTLQNTKKPEANVVHM